MLIALYGRGMDELARPSRLGTVGKVVVVLGTPFQLI